MIIENEVLEQIAESSFDWSFSHVLEFVARYKDPWPVLRAFHNEGYIILCDTNGEQLPQWRVDEIFRNRVTVIGVLVKVTPAGITRAYSM